MNTAHSKPQTFLIVGQGLAGTVLAWLLLRRGKQVTIVDDNHKTSSSRVAAGMWNPIVFRKVTKSWKADELLPIAESVYQSMEDQASWYHQQKVVRLFPTEDMREDFSTRLEEKAFSAYLSGERVPSSHSFQYHHDYGVVKGSGWLDVNAMLDHYSQVWQKEGILLQEEFVDDELDLDEQSANWKGKTYDQVIFCRGYQDKKSRWWRSLPIRFTKGEVLTLRINGLTIDQTFNNSKYLLPIGEHVFRLGATYDWETEDLSTTAAGKTELLDKLQTMLPSHEIEVLDHQAGIRPTVRDRRPIVGRHRSHPALSILNGLGTKGVMIAPWLATQLIQHLLDHQPLDAEVDLARWKGKEHLS